MSFKEFLKRVMGKKSKTTEKEPLKVVDRSNTDEAKTESNNSHAGLRTEVNDLDELIYDDLMNVLAKHYGGKNESDAVRFFYARAPGQLFRVILAIFTAGKQMGQYDNGHLGWFKARVGEELEALRAPRFSIVSNKDDKETLH